MKNLQAPAIEATGKYPVHKGYEVIETNGSSADGGSVDVMARDKDALAFMDVAAREGADKGMPNENLPAARERIEAGAAKWLAANTADDNLSDMRTRFDTIAMLVLGENKALCGTTSTAWTSACYSKKLAEGCNQRPVFGRKNASFSKFLAVKWRSRSGQKNPDLFPQVRIDVVVAGTGFEPMTSGL